MSAIVDALLAEMTDADLRELAGRLKPYLADGDGWLNTSTAAQYAGCSVHALRHAMAKGEVEYEQACPGGKTWFSRSALDRWRSGGGKRP